MRRMIFLEDVIKGDHRGERQCPKCKQWWPASHLDTDSGDCITCEDGEEEGPTIYDIDVSDFASINEDGIWCNYCGELLVAAFHITPTTTCPEECSTCGAPDPETMAEYFA